MWNIAIQILISLWTTYFSSRIIEAQKNRLSEAEIESLRSDFVRYFNELLSDLSLRENKLWEGWQILIWKNTYQAFQAENLDINNIVYVSNNLTDSNATVTWINNYLVYWEYKNLLNDLKSHMNAYSNTVWLCIKEYSDANRNKLKRERLALDEFVSENIDELKTIFIDFMISISNPWLPQAEREELLKNKDIFPLEKYVPSVRKFFDKIDNRVLGE